MFIMPIIDYFGLSEKYHKKHPHSVHKRNPQSST